MIVVRKRMPAILIASIVAIALIVAAGVLTAQSAYAADKQLGSVTYQGEKAGGEWLAHCYALDGKNGTITLEEMGIAVKDKNGSVVPADAYKTTLYYTWYDEKADKDVEKKAEEPYGLNPSSWSMEEGWTECVLKVAAVSGKGYKGTLKQHILLYDKYTLAYICSNITFNGAKNFGWRMMDGAIVPKSKAAKPKVLSADGTVLKEGKDYKVTYYTRVNDAKNNRDNITKGGKKLSAMPKKIGRYYLRITGIAPYYSTKDMIFDVSSSKNPTYLKAATSKGNPYKVAFKKVKKAKQTIAIEKLLKLQDNIVLMKKKDPFLGYPYQKVSGSNKLTLNKTNGKVTVKKGTKKGTYKIRIKVTPATIYSEQNIWGTKTYTCYVKVK